MRSERPEDMTSGRKINKTGMGTSPRLSKEMLEGAEKTQPTTPGDGEHMARVHAHYIKDAEPIGTVPPPTTLKGLFKAAGQAITGKKPTVLIDKVAERMAFERSGVRLYEGLIGKHKALGSFDGGPSHKELVRFQAEELEHFKMLKGTLERLGADPTAMTPSADVVGVESVGLGQVIGDPRMDLSQSLHAILVAELADKDGWDMLMALADELGQDKMAADFRHANEQEGEHLAAVRRWLTAYASGAAKLFDKQ